MTQPHSDDLRALSTTLHALQDARSATEAIEATLRAVRDAFGWAYGSFWRLDHARNALVFDQEIGDAGPAFRAVTQQASFERGVGLAGRTWLHGALQFAPDLGQVEDCCRAPVAVEAGVKSGVCIPLRTHGEIIGTLDFFSLTTLELTADRRMALETVGAQLSSTLDAIHRAEDAEEARRDAEALTEVLGTLGQADGREQTLRQVLQVVRTAFGWDYGSVWRLDEEQGALKFWVESGTVDADFAAATAAAAFPRGVGLSGRTWKRMALTFVPDLAEVHDCSRAPAARAAGVKSGVCLPLTVNGELVATMDFFTTRSLAALAPSRQSSLEQVASQVSAVLTRMHGAELAARESAELQLRLTRGVGEVRDSLNQQTALASEQASAVAEVTSSLSELRQTSRQALENAESLLDVSEQARTGAVRGLDTVKQSIAGMQDIQERVETIQVRINGLSEHTQQIGEIITTVNEIAEQSKLLALNASIEAARAGEFGRSFSVVANEMRDLAEQSKQATRQVRQLLSDIREATTAAAVATEDGIAKVQTGQVLASETGSAMDALVTAVETAADASRLIASASRQQGAGVDQVADAMVNIDSAMRDATDNLGTIERVASELANTADDLDARAAA